jgi:large subunit ribosomal protein L17
LEKAKAIKGDVDKIITKAKKGDKTLATQLLKRSVGLAEIDKVINEIAPRFKDRNSGYTRIIKLGRRFSDNASMVVMEWVVKPEVKVEVKGLPSGKASEKKVLPAETKKAEKTEPKKKETKKKDKK